MRLIYLGSGEFGLPVLRRLHAHHEVCAVVTQPDKPAGRKRVPTATPVGQWATESGLQVIKTDNANDPAVVEQVAALRADAGVVIAFGQKLSPALIDAAAPVVVNLHASLLPKYRGAAPINWAIIAGERETGLSVISLAQKMDAGKIYAQARTAIDPLETAGELHDRLAEMGPALIDRVLADHEAGALSAVTQDDTQATRAPKLSKADGVVDFNHDADTVRCRIHGLTPWPGVHVTWTRQADGREQPLLIRRVRTGRTTDAENGAQAPGTILDDFHVAVRGGTIQLLEVQAPGGKALPVETFARGHPLTPGDVLR